MNCDSVILLHIDKKAEGGEEEILQLEQGELFEYKCPNCNHWSCFEIVD